MGEWSLDKRHYMGQGPPLSLEAPPQCAHDRAFVLRALWNNASAALAAQKEGMGWSGTGGGGAANPGCAHATAPATTRAMRQGAGRRAILPFPARCMHGVQNADSVQMPVCTVSYG